MGLSITNGYELIDSRVIGVFEGKFEVYLGDITFRFVFMQDNEEFYTDIENIEDENICIVSVKIHNLNTGNVQGRFQPYEYNSPIYYFSLTGIDTTDSQDKIVFFSLFREQEPAMGVNSRLEYLSY